MTIKRHTLYIIVMLMSAAMMLPACGNGVVFDDYDHTPIDGWENDDTLSFSVPRMKASGTYIPSVGLRTTSEFPFTAISLVVEQTVEPGHRIYTDTINCRLSDDRGNQLGRGINYFQYECPLPQRFLRQGDSLHVTVRHIMKREILPGISDIGLKLTKRQ